MNPTPSITGILLMSLSCIAKIIRVTDYIPLYSIVDMMIKLLFLCLCIKPGNPKELFWHEAKALCV